MASSSSGMVGEKTLSAAWSKARFSDALPGEDRIPNSLEFVGSAGATIVVDNFVASIRVESIVTGGGVKLNGFIVSDLPGLVDIKVDQSGKSLQQYVIALSTNVLDVDTARFVIEPGEAAPGRIYFDRTGAQVSAHALVRPAR